MSNKKMSLNEKSKNVPFYRFRYEFERVMMAQYFSDRKNEKRLFYVSISVLRYFEP